jgi:hypothetical protein
MVGFIKGLFGSKAKKQGDLEQGDAAPPAKDARSQAYFLDADSAKTLGDVDYMRTAKAVRRTFPKTLANPQGFEKISQISSLEQLKAMKDAAVAPEAIAKIDAQIKAVQLDSAASQGSQTQSSSGSDGRRSADSSMDMFRNMARDLKKPR